MISKKGKGVPPVTFLGRLHHHMAAFGHMVSRLGFVSNLTFKLKLADGMVSTPDHHVISSTDLHASEVAALKAAVAKDVVTPPAVDGSHLFVFERTGLGLLDQETFVKGRLAEVIHNQGDRVGVISLYDALRGSVFTKTGVTQEFTTTEEFYERKTLCRADIEAIFLKGLAQKRFHDNWRLVERDLLADGMNSRLIIALHNSCIRYINARSSGEPGAVDFNAVAQDALLANQAAVSACPSVSGIASLLDGWVPSDYEHRLGALHVEAFEAIA